MVDETIEGETIVIHLGTGVYYSLDGAASVIWDLAGAGAPTETIVALVGAAYPANNGTVAPEVESLLAELLSEELLTQGPAPAETFSGLAPAMPEVYATPVLHRYTDMQAFMLTDPIHEVDQGAGWPHVKTA